MIKIQYHFKGDPSEKYYICDMTKEEYTNFKVIPAVEWCIILNKTVESHKNNVQSIEDALRIVLQKDQEEFWIENGGSGAFCIVIRVCKSRLFCKTAKI